MDNPNYYNVKVIGDFFKSIGGGAEAVGRFGPLVLKLPRWEHCQGFCRTHILPELIRKADPTFTQIRQCFVLEIKTSQGELVQGLPIQLMSREQIIQQIEQNHVKMIPEMYPDISVLRSKFRRAKNNRDEFEKQEKVSAKTFSTVRDTMALNRDLYKAAEAAPANADPLIPEHMIPAAKELPDPAPAGSGGYHPHGKPGGPPPGHDIGTNKLPAVTTLGADNKPVDDSEFSEADMDF